jgi:tRNA threonylcarbamoyladenosine biosynthesis protein TsaB
MDTTTPRGSVAFADTEVVLGEVRLTSPTPHSTRLLAAVEFLLDGLGLSPLEIEGYAVTTGPGSFTGLRVGIGTVQGLALGSGRPCLGVPALDVLAARIRGTASHLVAMTDAFRGEVYAALYDGEARPLGGPRLCAPAAFLRDVPVAAAFLGDGATRYRSQVLDSCPAAVFSERSLYLAGTLARLAQPRLVAGEGAGPELLRPLYLRGADGRPGPP